MICDVLAERAFTRCVLEKARRAELYGADNTLISDPDLAILFRSVRDFVVKFNGVPTHETLFAHLHSTLQPEERARAWQAYGEVMALAGVEPDNFEFYRSRLEQFRVGRELMEAQNEIRRALGEGQDFEAARAQVVGRLLRASPGMGGVVWRGFVADDAKIRWDEYKASEKGMAVTDAFPYGISFFDRETGGIWPETLILFFGRSNVGKSRIMISVGYNVAQRNEPVLYLSLEMGHRLLKRCFDARHAMIDSSQIRCGSLDVEGREKLKFALQSQLNQQPPFYIVDLPSNGVRVSDLYREIEMFKARHGTKPRLCIIDYAGLMRPHEKWTTTSEKYQLLFEELHAFTRTTRVPTVTAMIESRTSSQKKGKGGEGMEMVGLSNYIVPNVDVAIQLRAKPEELIQGQVKAIVVKNRDDRNGSADWLYAKPENSYVGDPRIAVGAKIG